MTVSNSRNYADYRHSYLERWLVKYNATASLHSFFHIKAEDLAKGMCFLHMDVEDSYIDEHLLAIAQRLNSFQALKLVLLIDKSSRAYFEKAVHSESDFEQLKDRFAKEEEAWVKTYGFMLKLFKQKPEIQLWHNLTSDDGFADCLKKVEKKHEKQERFKKVTTDFIDTEIKKLFQSSKKQSTEARACLRDFAFERCAALLHLQKIGEGTPVFFISKMGVVTPFEYLQKYAKNLFYDIRVRFQESAPVLIPEPTKLGHLSFTSETKSRSAVSFYTFCQVKADDFVRATSILELSLSETYDEKKTLTRDLDDDFAATLNALNRYQSERVIFLIRDGPEVHIERIINPSINISDLRANHKHKEKGWIEKRSAIFNRLSHPCQVMYWDAMLEHSHYSSCLALIGEIYEDNPLFKIYVDRAISYKIKQCMQCEDYKKAIAKNQAWAEQCVRDFIFEKCAIALLREKLFPKTQILLLHFQRLFKHKGRMFLRYHPLFRPIEWLQQYYLKQSFVDVVMRFKQAEENTIGAST